ncbi:Acyl-CoA synthetase (AMP-forming)/AMP-acid ligase II [Amycolatopsis xylanica]|uniref:Acyl-CoA synthetase (AMP-forming)/AMP-acid ligase II n=1 Tax=Amycolatopsis xylanica TaxID=589385 RepID=A0A1H3NQV8_9PSEU|nr:AMP-binding protein [Amycolatopsis xylanica]SDY91178.1 Acyl-CoA synthetase (AMP-forming)/AMP-acid ligase II [Amycolatopsis xylanica]
MRRHAELDPRVVLDGGAPGETPWSVRWDRLSAADREHLIARSAPCLDIKTSGSTGAATVWRRTREQLVSEAELLAGLWSGRRIDAVLAFAPPAHLYGVLTTVLVPALLGVPVWYQPSFDVDMPAISPRGLGVGAIPWTFRILARHPEFLSTVDELSILHSTATLPPEAHDLPAPGDVRITEIFGSTETGGIAHRTGETQPWTLFDDVKLLGDDSGEIPLVVAGPRLAGELTEWRTDDFVEVVDARRFRFLGRRGRLCKINGLRVNLDTVQAELAERVRCADLACFPVRDALRGESFLVRVVGSGTELPQAVRAAAKELGLNPQAVELVDRIDRSETGKLRA